MYFYSQTLNQAQFQDTTDLSYTPTLNTYHFLFL